MTLAGVRCVVFDIDDTLYLERDYVRSGFRAVDRWVLANLSREGFFSIAWRLFEQGHRGRIFDEALAGIGRAPDEAIVAAMVGEYRRLTARYGDGYGKPHPRAFEEIGMQLGCEGPACVYVADNPAKDFKAPRQLGWRTVRVRRAGSLHEAVASGEDVEIEMNDLRGFDA